MYIPTRVLKAIAVLCIALSVAMSGYIIYLACQLSYADAATKKPCDEIHQAYSDVLYRVWIDNPNYVEDVLNETDEWCKLYDLVGEAWINYTFKCAEDSLAYKSNLNHTMVYDPVSINWAYIPDSTYEKLRGVFPDLPPVQVRPDKIEPVEPIEMP